MSTFKKLLALTLALAMVLSVSAFAGYTVAPYGDADKVDEDCEVAVQLLYSLNIMKGDDKGNFNPTATITRAEIAKMIYVILNYGKDDKAVNYTGAKLFSDVTAGAWYEGYVNYAATTKLVQGRGNGTFGPNDPVTTAEAAKMLLTAIGYSAEARGYVGAGWDKQVLSDAAIIGLLDGYNYSTTTYAPRQWVAVMFKNALTDAYTYGTIAPVIFNGLLNGTTLPSGDYKTMGEKYYNMAAFEGVITANEYADLYGSKTKSAGRTVLDNKLSLKVSSDLTEIGESRWGYYNTKTNEVYYIGDTGDNTEFSTGAGTTIVKKYIDGIKLNDKTEYFLNFDESNTVKEAYETANGEWLRVVDNDDDGYAEYVFVTEFEMTEVTKVAKDDTVFLANGKDSDEFEMSEEVAAGDVVLYTKIDDVEYVEIADTFEGQAEKYTYKTDVLTVDGEDYGQSGITVSDAFENAYYTEIKSAQRKTDYVFYKDFFGFIRAYSEPVGADGEIVLLTDAYYETKRDGKTAAVIAYLDDELTDVDVSTSIYTDMTDFIETGINGNSWDRLIEFNGADDQYVTEETNDGKTVVVNYGASTNLARYTTDDDGVMSLYTATTYYYNNKGQADGIKTDYIDLVNKDVKAGQTAYEAYASAANASRSASNNIKVQVNNSTVFYYVSQYYGDIVAVTGYKNSYDVIDEYVDICAMYAVASNIESDSAKAPYWVADAVVIETVYPVFNLNNNIVLGYDVVNKTVSDFASLDVISGDATLDNLSVTNVNGYNTFNKGEITVPAFYFNTENADGESHIRKITTNFAANGIYAVKADRVIDLDDYFEIVTNGNDGPFYYTEDSVVYDLEDEGNYISITDEDIYEDKLTIKTGMNYILVVDDDDNIVYAIQVESYDDVAVALYTSIDASAPAVDELSKAKADAVKVLTDWAAEVEGAMGLTEGALDDVLAEQLKAVKACDTIQKVAGIIAGTRADVVLDGSQTGASAIYDKGAELKAANDEANATYTLAIDNQSKRGVVINGKAYEKAIDSVTELKKGDVLTLTSGINVTVSATGNVEVVMGADMQHWTITIKGAGSIRICSAN